jgi:hypothetical protein
MAHMRLGRDGRGVEGHWDNRPDGDLLTGRFIHSPHTGDVVKISSIHDPWYASSWVGARRF